MNVDIPDVPEPELATSLGFNPYDYWPLRLTFILFGYLTVIIPAYLLIVFVKKRYQDISINQRHSKFQKFLILFAIGRTPYQGLPTEEKQSDQRHSEPTQGFCKRDGFLLFIYFLGIQLNHVAAGFFQERIITQGYPRSDDTFVVDKFGDAQFLVLLNRIVALVLCGLYLVYDYRSQPPHDPPFYMHSFSSISNTLSSWCQYEALKFVSFPAMTVCKASKLIPTMLMGRLIRNKTYSSREYLTAFILVTGACSFFLSSQSYSISSKVTTVSGIFLMAGYLGFDAFTPNWQKKLFDGKAQVSKAQTMVGVNSFSAVLCFVSLLEQGTLFSSISFMISHDGFARDAFLLSLASACGQVFIYAIVKDFGPEVLAVIMTLRQILSIILSSIYFSHPLNISGIIGLSLVFGAIFYSKYTEYYDNGSKRVVKT